jgi:hypothetical protein
MLARRADPSGATCITLVLRAPAVDMCPVGRPRRMPNRKFCAFERQYRCRQASWWLVLENGE